jgi:hypothetical protein
VTSYSSKGPTCWEAQDAGCHGPISPWGNLFNNSRMAGKPNRVCRTLVTILVLRFCSPSDSTAKIHSEGQSLQTLGLSKLAANRLTHFHVAKCFAAGHLKLLALRAHFKNATRPASRSGSPHPLWVNHATFTIPQFFLFHRVLVFERIYQVKRRVAPSSRLSLVPRTRKQIQPSLGMPC